MRWGIRAVIGESFAEIFHGNCLALGIPCLIADHDTLLEIQATVQPADPCRLDLERLEIVAALTNGERRWGLSLASGPRSMFLSGQWDGTGQLLAQDHALNQTAARLPYLSQFAA